jgi:hypothetical protein
MLAEPGHLAWLRASRELGLAVEGVDLFADGGVFVGDDVVGMRA